MARKNVITPSLRREVVCHISERPLSKSGHEVLSLLMFVELYYASVQLIGISPLIFF
jgi:hypothetical protein